MADVENKRTDFFALLVYASVVTSKAAMQGHFKTGHMDWPET